MQAAPEAESSTTALYEAAEDAAAAGVPLETALQAVRDGYSSHEADVICAADP
jgi:hypothetical protein